MAIAERPSATHDAATRTPATSPARSSSDDTWGSREPVEVAGRPRDVGHRPHAGLVLHVVRVEADEDVDHRRQRPLQREVADDDPPRLERRDDEPPRRLRGAAEPTIGRPERARDHSETRERDERRGGRLEDQRHAPEQSRCAGRPVRSPFKRMAQHAEASAAVVHQISHWAVSQKLKNPT